MLGGHAAVRAGLAELLGLVFHYDAREIISKVESHVVLSRYAARNVLRQVALLLLDRAALTSERFKEIVTALKDIPFGWRWLDGRGKANSTGSSCCLMRRLRFRLRCR